MDAALKQMLEAIQTSTNGLPARFKGLEEMIDKRDKALRGDLETAIKRIEALEQHGKTRGVSLPGSEREQHKGETFQFIKAIQWMLAIKSGHSNPDKVAPLEAAILREATEKADHLPSSSYVGKDMEASTDSLGGWLVPNEIMANSLIQLLVAAVVLLKAGVTQMPNLSGSPVEIPREETDTTAYWVGETEAPTPSDMGLGMLTLEPHCAAAMTKLSQRLVRMSTPAAEMIVRRSLTRKCGLLIDLAGLRGTGGSSQPLGAVNSSGIGSVAIGTNGGEITDDILIDIMSAVRNANGLEDGRSVGWIMPPQVLTKIEKLKDSNGRPLFLRASEGSLAQKPSEGLLKGFPVYTTTQMPVNLTKGSGTGLGEILFGDMSTIVFGQWGGFEIKVSDVSEDAMKKRQIHVLAFQEVDFAVQQPGRLAICTDVKTS